MSTHNICFFYKEVDKSTLVVIFYITKLLDCALIGACAVMRSNTVIFLFIYLFFFFAKHPHGQVVDAPDFLFESC